MKHVHVHFYDAETAHDPANGQFTSGSGGSTSSKSHFEAPKPLPKFVHEFIREHGTGEKMAAHLKTKPDAHLHKALELLDKHGGVDVASKLVREHITAELARRKGGNV